MDSAEQEQRGLFQSLVFKMGAMLMALVTLALTTLLSSYLVIEEAERDAETVNLAGSLRMTCYQLLASRLGDPLDSAATQVRITRLLRQFENRLGQSESFMELQGHAETAIHRQVERVRQGWVEEIRPLFVDTEAATNVPAADLTVLIDRYVDEVDALVGLYQAKAESRIENLRVIQLSALFLTLVLVTASLLILHRRVELPLRKLTEAARRIGQGDFSQKVDIDNQDELDLLATTINQMSTDLGQIYGELEARVASKTRALARSADSLNFLYRIARDVSERNRDSIDFRQWLRELAAITGFPCLDLCLKTRASPIPYLSLHSDAMETRSSSDCAQARCHECLERDQRQRAAPDSNSLFYPVVREGIHYGVLVCRMLDGSGADGNVNGVGGGAAGMGNGFGVGGGAGVSAEEEAGTGRGAGGEVGAVDGGAGVGTDSDADGGDHGVGGGSNTSLTGAAQEWQHQLLQSFADQVAVACSLQNQADQDRRASLLNERSIIARELHDSLAQALSYLKIQVARLRRGLQRPELSVTELDAITGEVSEGIGSAYRQLRELLTTFRLSISEEGLAVALSQTVDQFRRQHPELDIRLTCGIERVPLAPNEEIHVLQLAREALQNAVRHAEGRKILLSLEESGPSRVRLRIVDDGKGLPERPERDHHHGFAIMRERARTLGGDLEFLRPAGGGTEVRFTFSPAALASATHPESSPPSPRSSTPSPRSPVPISAEAPIGTPDAAISRVEELAAATQVEVPVDHHAHRIEPGKTE